MTNPNYIDRHELSRVLEVSVYVIRSNEKRWKLDECRADLNARMVRYHRAKAMQKLLRLGLLPQLT